MGARNLTKSQFSLERDVVRLFARGTGAATSSLTAVKGKGIASIARTGTGAHTITLQDWWAGLLMFSAAVIDPNSTDDWEVVVVEDKVSDSTAKTLKIAIFKGGTAADLSTDEKILLEIILSNTNTLPKGF